LASRLERQYNTEWCRLTSICPVFATGQIFFASFSNARKGTPPLFGNKPHLMKASRCNLPLLARTQDERFTVASFASFAVKNCELLFTFRADG
jgi:hypothetical protein